MKTKNKGITLIALVITIIILLILAGVTIGQLTGNGLFEKVQLAKQKTEQKQQEENATLGDYENQINEYIAGNRDSKTSATAENTLSGLEHFIGEYYFNGKPIYSRTFYISSLPNSREVYYNHGISDVDKIWFDTSNCFAEWSDGFVAPLPFVNNYIECQIMLTQLDKTKFNIGTTGYNRSNVSAYITLNYTKTTDVENNTTMEPTTLTPAN